mgnify:FL=1
MYGRQLPSIKDDETEIAKFKYNHPCAWEFDFQTLKTGETIMRGLFQSMVNGDDKRWQPIATLQKIA